MPLPASVTLTTITGDVLHPVTGAASNGTVTFAFPPPPFALRTSDGHMLGNDATTVTLINGAFPAGFQLPATDGVNISPQGWAYTVTVNTDTYVGTFPASLPSNPSSVAFSALVPVVTPPTVASYVLLSDPRISVRPYAPVTLTDGPTITTDASQGTLFRVTLGGNRTLANPTNPVDGQRVLWAISQDATGSRTLALGTAFNSGAVSVTLSTAANKVDYMGAIYRSATARWDVLAFASGY